MTPTTPATPPKRRHPWRSFDTGYLQRNTRHPAVPDRRFCTLPPKGLPR